MDETITSKGYFRFTFGNLQPIKMQKTLCQMLMEYNLDGLQVIAFDELSKNTAFIAQEKEQTLLEESLASN